MIYLMKVKWIMAYINENESIKSIQNTTTHYPCDINCITLQEMCKFMMIVIFWNRVNVYIIHATNFNCTVVI